MCDIQMEANSELLDGEIALYHFYLCMCLSIMQSASPAPSISCILWGAGDVGISCF